MTVDRARRQGASSPRGHLRYFNRARAGYVMGVLMTLTLSAAGPRDAAVAPMPLKVLVVCMFGPEGGA